MYMFCLVTAGLLVHSGLSTGGVPGTTRSAA